MDTSSREQFFIQPAIRSYRFCAGTILLGLNVTGGLIMFVRHLRDLPFGAAGGLIAAMVLLVSSWLFVLRRHQQISILINGRREPPEKLVRTTLSASADVMETGIILTNLVVLMLMAAIVQIIMVR